jgi:formamidopyrimidine-DNA glycosylase
MPELPEVETIRTMLLNNIKDEEIIDVKVVVPRIVHLDINEFRKKLVNAKIKDITRRGKYLLIHLSNDYVLVSHLRMEGKYFFIDKESYNPPYTAVIFYFNDNKKLVYTDSRKFGTMELVKESELNELKSLKKLGPEPFEVDGDYLYAKTSKTSKPIKNLLMDQTVLSGLGNIYTDEVLFLSKIHPLTPANLLTRNNCIDIINHSVDVLHKAIEMGGTTVRSYGALNGEAGKFQVNLLVYGRKGQECFVCGTKLKKIEVGGRGTVYCPYCQKNPASPLVVGITGQIGAGKSTILAYLKSKGEEVIDSDEIVADLYKRPDVSAKVQKVFSENILNEAGIVDKTLLIAALMNNEKKIYDLNEVVHPLVKDELSKIIKASHAPRLFIEIALPFSYKINELMNYLIGIEAPVEKQMQYLANRKVGPLFIRPDEEYSKHRSELDFIIINDQSLTYLYNMVDNIIEKL